MSIVGGFFNAKNVNGIYDRAYNAEDFAAYFANFISSGVFAKPSDQMKVVPGGGLSVDVSVGKGYIKGYWVNVTQTEHIVINPNMTGHEEQIKIVCRIDFDTRFPVLEVRENVDSLLPESEYELVLATFNLQVGESEITTAMITDRRPDKEYCGFVTGLVDQVDFKTLMEQEKAQFQEWFEDMKGQLSEDAAGNLQTQIDNLVIPTKTSELINDGGTYKDGKKYFVRRGCQQYDPYDFGPDELYYNTRTIGGVVGKLDSNMDQPQTWCSGYDVKGEEGAQELSLYANPSWRNDWRAYSSDTTYLNGRPIAVGGRFFIHQNTDGMFIMFVLRAKRKARPDYYGTQIYLYPMMWVHDKLGIPLNINVEQNIGEHKTNIITEQFILYDNSRVKICQGTWGFRFVRTITKYDYGQISMTEEILTEVLDITWYGSYTSSLYELQLHEVPEIGSNLYTN